MKLETIPPLLALGMDAESPQRGTSEDLQQTARHCRIVCRFRDAGHDRQ